MKRSYIYLIVILLTVTLVSADYIIGKDLSKIMPLDEQYRSIETVDPTTKDANAVAPITIKNEQNSDKVYIYEYTLKVDNIKGAYRYTYNEEESYLIFAANGEAHFKIKSNESITIYDLPIGYDYMIKQETILNTHNIKVNDRDGNAFNSKVNYENVIIFNNAPINGHQEPPKQEHVETETKETEEPVETKPVETKPTKPDKKDIPNTGTKEIKTVILLLLALFIIYAIRKIRVKRFD